MICPINNAKKLLSWLLDNEIILRLYASHLLFFIEPRKKNWKTLYEYIIKACWLDYSIHHTQQEKFQSRIKIEKLCDAWVCKQNRSGLGIKFLMDYVGLLNFRGGSKNVLKFNVFCIFYRILRID